MPVAPDQALPACSWRASAQCDVQHCHQRQRTAPASVFMFLTGLVEFMGSMTEVGLWTHIQALPAWSYERVISTHTCCAAHQDELGAVLPMAVMSELYIGLRRNASSA